MAVSSVETASDTSATEAARPGATRGTVTRAAAAGPEQPSDRATSSRPGGTSSSDARTLTTARGRNSTAYAASSTTTVW